MDNYALSLKKYDQRQLQAMIENIETRLGTPDEKPDDMVRVQAIAHALNNILTGIRLSS